MKNKTYSSLSVAKFFLKRGGENYLSPNPFKVMKLIYLAHGWHLSIFEKPLISEFIHKGENGPEIRSIRRKIDKCHP
jgi:uncharacterized phage-associated protein